MSNDLLKDFRQYFYKESNSILYYIIKIHLNEHVFIARASTAAKEMFVQISLKLNENW